MPDKLTIPAKVEEAVVALKLKGLTQRECAKAAGYNEKIIGSILAKHPETDSALLSDKKRTEYLRRYNAKRRNRGDCLETRS
jgi:hypothetical protein